MPPYKWAVEFSVENVESIQIGLKELICLLEVCRSSSSLSYAMDWRPSSTFVTHIHHPNIKCIRQGVLQAILFTEIRVKANSLEHFIRYGSIDKGPFNLNLSAMPWPLQSHESNLPYHNEERNYNAYNTLVGPCVGKESIESRPQRSSSSKLPQVRARYHTLVSPIFRLSWLEHTWHY